MPPNGNSWDEYRKFVVEKLDTHSGYFDEMFKRLGNIEIELARLKLKAGVWGLLAGTIPVAIMIILFLIRNHLTQ